MIYLYKIRLDLRKVVLIIMVVLSLLTVSSYGQDITFRHINTDDGLSQFSINALYKDEDGFIWIGTRDGLNRYNSNAVKTFRLHKNDTTSLFCNNVLRITGNQNGKIYLLCTEGVSQLDLQSETFRTILLGEITAMTYHDKLFIGKDNQILTYDESTGKFNRFYTLSNGRAVISSLHIDSKGTMWIGTSENGLFTLNNAKKLTNIIPRGNITNIYEDSKERLWIGSWEHGLWRYENGKMTNYRNNRNNPNTIASDFARCCCEDEQGNIWIGTFLGLNKLDPETDKFTLYTASEGEGGLSHSSIWSIIKDHQGTIWLGTYFGGVNYFNPRYSIYTQYRNAATPDKGLSSPIVGRMIEDSDKNLWICTEGGGVNVLDRKTNTFKWYRHSPQGNSISHNNVKAIYADTMHHAMWIGTHLGGLNKLDLRSGHFSHYGYIADDTTSLPSGIVRDIIPYKEKLIIATQSGVCLFDPKTGRSSPMFFDHSRGIPTVKTVADLHFDHKGTLWLAATGEGLYSYRFDTGELRNYRHNSNDQHSLSSNNINNIYTDSRNNLWISTSGTGLDLFRYETNDFANFDSRSNALSSDCVYEVAELSDGKLLVITNQGLSQFDLDKQIFYNYSRNNGFPLTAVNENAMLIASDGTVFLGGTQGLISFREKELDFSFNPYKIIPYKLIVDGKEVAVGDDTGILKTTLSHSKRIKIGSRYSVFGIEFATSNFVLANNHDIVYKLEGFSDQWTSTRGQNTITYTNLNPGTYRLIIKSLSTPGDQSPQAELIIEVPPPFYKTTLAYIAYLIIVLLIMYYYIRAYNAKIKLQESLKYEKQHIQDIEELNQSKLRFFTNISHEFRTPLTLIIGQIEMLLQIQSFTPTIYNKVQAVYKNSLQLRELISELLDFRKQEQGHMKIKVAEHDVVAFLYENFLLFLEYASTKHINFLFDKQIDRMDVWYDSKQMQKVINNLVSNALKHTMTDDTITIAVRKDNNDAIFEVTDTGTGIDSGEVDKIFDRFYQTEKLDSLTSQGTGIGLALTKGIVELHAGTIKVHSVIGRGTTFTVRLPLGNDHFIAEQITPQDEMTQNRSEVPTKAESNFTAEREEMDQNVYKRIHGAKMLIVEDNDSLREMLEGIFNPMYDVITACDGEQGLEMALRCEPQIIVSDVVMPKMSGTELCKRIKNDINTCHIPVVLLTARTAIEYNIEGLRIGADDYITKPFNLNILVSRCNNLVNSRIVMHEKFSRLPSEQAQMMATNPLDKKLLDKATLIIDRYIEDPDFNINMFAREMGMARTNLFAKIKAITGKTPNDFISVIRLHRAAIMLRNNHELNISEISDRTGFSSSRYFSKCFKDAYHISPLSYRKGLSEDDPTEIRQNNND